MDFRTKSLWRNELNATLGELESLSEGNKALSDRIVHSEIRSPIRGTVKRLAVNTTGAVIMPGGLVAEIVPDEEALFVETQLSPRDRAFIRPGILYIQVSLPDPSVNFNRGRLYITLLKYRYSDRKSVV